MRCMVAFAYPLTIFYDASCPVCREEIGLLQRYDTEQRLAFEDCSPPNYTPPSDAPTHVTRAAMMSLIHARDAQGHWLVGAPVFAAAYAGCGFAEFAWAWGHPRLQKFWAVVYPLVARHRMLISRLGVGHALGFLMKKLSARAAQRAASASKSCAVGTPGAKNDGCGR